MEPGPYIWFLIPNQRSRSLILASPSSFSARLRPLVCADIQADVEDGQLQYFYLLAFVLQGNTAAQTFFFIAWRHALDLPFAHDKMSVFVRLSERVKMILHDVARRVELALWL